MVPSNPQTATSSLEGYLTRWMEPQLLMSAPMPQ